MMMWFCTTPIIVVMVYFFSYKSFSFVRHPRRPLPSHRPLPPAPWSMH